MKRLFFFAATLVFVNAAQAKSYGWIQFFSNELDQQLTTGSASDAAKVLTSPQNAKDKLQAFEKTFASKGANLTAQEKSDYAAVLLLLHGDGAADRALELLKAAEKEYPQQYVIAINAATALELSNYFDESKTWLEEARTRNRQPYLGSEWLQALIIEAKRQMQADPEWLNQNTVLGEDFGDGDLPHWPKVADHRQWAVRTKLALFNQLRGRMKFANPPDPLIGDLIFDLANLEVLTANNQGAVQLYELALKYQPPRRQLAELRLQKLKSTAANENKTASKPLFAAIGAAILLAGVSILIWQKRKKSRKSMPLPKS